MPSSRAAYPTHPEPWLSPDSGPLLQPMEARTRQRPRAPMRVPTMTMCWLGCCTGASQLARYGALVVYHRRYTTSYSVACARLAVAAVGVQVAGTADHEGLAPPRRHDLYPLGLFPLAFHVQVAKGAIAPWFE